MIYSDNIDTPSKYIIFMYRLLDRNNETYWVPDTVREGRFANWLENARDWNISR